MILFPITPTEEIRLRVAAVTARGRELAARRAAAAARAHAREVEQLALFEGASARPPARQKRGKPAPRQRPPAAGAIASVFDLATVSTMPRIVLRSSEGRKTAAVAARGDDGAVRYEGVAYPAYRWTAEDEERERARRARQKPPRPPKQTFRLRKD